MTEARVTSGILQDDALDRVRDVLQFVQSLFDLVDDVLPPEQELRRVLGVEAVEVRSGVAVEPVPLVLQLVDPDPEGPQRLPIEVPQVLQAGGGLLGGRADQPGLPHDRVDRFGHERIAWVRRSPSCSASARRLAFISGSTKSSTMSSSSRAASARLSPAASNRSKKDSSRGKIRSFTNSLPFRGIAACKVAVAFAGCRQVFIRVTPGDHPVRAPPR